MAGDAVSVAPNLYKVLLDNPRCGYWKLGTALVSSQICIPIHKAPDLPRHICATLRPSFGIQ